MNPAEKDSLAEYIALQSLMSGSVLIGPDFGGSRARQEVQSASRVPLIVWSSLPFSRPDFLRRLGAAVGRLAAAKGVQLLVGIATAGIPLAVAASLESGIPSVILRPTLKSHGPLRQIDGQYEAGSKALVVDNFLNTGATVLRAIDILEDSGLVVQGIVCVELGGMAPLPRRILAHDLTWYISLAQKVALMAKMGYFPGGTAGHVLDYIAAPHDFFAGSPKYRAYIDALSRAPDLSFVVRPGGP